MWYIIKYIYRFIYIYILIGWFLLKYNIIQYILYYLIILYGIYFYTFAIGSSLIKKSIKPSQTYEDGLSPGWTRLVIHTVYIYNINLLLLY